MTELAQMRLLIVGDDVAGRELLTHSLAQAGYADIVSTGDPTRAHQLCVAEQPDLVVFDLDMPGLSLQALSKIRHLTEPPESLPVLVLTADNTRGARDRALSMGARDFITKPIDQTELLLRVGNVLHTRQLQQQLN